MSDFSGHSACIVCGGQLPWLTDGDIGRVYARPSARWLFWTSAGGIGVTMSRKQQAACRYAVDDAVAVRPR